MRIILICLMNIFFVACGSESYSNHQLGEAREEDNSLPDFSTRLTNNLLIAGDQCAGGEETVSQGQSFICDATEWLITVDNINTCTPEGCTEVGVVPVIAILVPTSSQGDSDFFDIDPSIPVEANIRAILETVTVRFSPNQQPLVLFK